MYVCAGGGWRSMTWFGSMRILVIPHNLVQIVEGEGVLRSIWVCVEVHVLGWVYVDFGYRSQFGSDWGVQNYEKGPRPPNLSYGREGYRCMIWVGSVWILVITIWSRALEGY